MIYTYITYIYYMYYVFIIYIYIYIYVYIYHLYVIYIYIYLFMYINVLYILYIYIYNRNNVLSRLSPQSWLCGNSCSWAHDERLHIPGTIEPKSAQQAKQEA